MTRRLVAAALIAGSFGLVSPALAQHNDAEFCLGSDDRQNAGRMIGYCIRLDDPSGGVLGS